jgi:hypothetical protein
MIAHLALFEEFLEMPKKSINLSKVSGHANQRGGGVGNFRSMA